MQQVRPTWIFTVRESVFGEVEWVDWRRFAFQPNQRETGATLLGVIGIALVLSLLTASILSFTLQSAQSVLFNREHTQALYNARMGVDAAVELIDYELSAASPPATIAQLVPLVTADLNKLSSQPFQVTFSSSQNKTANTLEITSKGIFGGAVVVLTMDVAVSFPSSGSYQVSATGAADSPNVSISGTGGATVSVTGTGSAAVSVNGTTATVSGFSNQQNIQDNYNFFVSPVRDVSAWVEGSYNFVQGVPFRNLIVTGNGNWTFGNVDGTAIVSGTNAIIFGNIGGPLIVAGSGAVIYGNTHCALITGNNVTVTNNVKGNVVITGNNVTIYGSVKPGRANQDVVITGNNVTIYGDIDGHLIATGTNEVVWGTIKNGLTENGQNVTYGRVRGGISQFQPGPITIQTPCLGQVTVQSGANGKINGGATLIPSSSSVSG